MEEILPYCDNNVKNSYRYPDILEILITKLCLYKQNNCCWIESLCYNNYFAKFHKMIHKFLRCKIVQYGPGLYDFYLIVKLPGFEII